MQKILIVVVCVVAVAIREGSGAMSEAQIKSAGKLLKNLCQPKTKITAAQIEEIHKGIFNEDQTIKNYMECILRTGQLMKDGALNMEFIQTSLDNMPESLKTSSAAALEACKGAQGADKFELAFNFYKCFYEYNPEKFFLP